MKSTFRRVLVGILILAVVALSGCGAAISTKLTVDSKFAGSRVITATISGEDLGEVTGGLDALNQVANDNLPEGMTYSSAPSEDGAVLTFTVKFTDIEDYRQKVSKIYAAGLEEGDDDVPEVIYENQDTIFKDGLKFSENFTSVDLLDWYMDALEQAAIISESRGNWYETADSTIVIDGTEYDSSSDLEIDEQTKRCLNSIEVETVIGTDGTYKRTITFSADEDTIKELKSEGCNLKDYLKKLCPKDDKFKVEENEYTGDTEYTFTIKADSAKKLVEKTNKILQTKNKLSVDVKPKKEKGKADITVKESLDGSYYLDYEYSNPLTSTLKVYDNVEYENEDYDYGVNEGEIIYYPSIGNEYEFKGEWKIGFKSVELIANASSDKKAEVSLVFNPLEGMDKEIIKSAGSVVEAAAKKGGKLKVKDNVYTVNFKGTTQEIEKEINSFVAGAIGKTLKKEDSYFTISLDKYSPKSKFKSGVVGDIYYDFSSIIGNSKITLNNQNGLFSDVYYTDTDIDEDNKIFGQASDSISFYSANISILAAILMLVFVCLLAFGVIFVVVNRSEFALFKDVFAKKTAPTETEVVAVEAETTAEEAEAAPVKETVTVAAPTEAAEEISEEEEDDLI